MMTQDYDNFHDFPNEPEDDGIAPEVGIKKLKQDIERKNKQISDVERMAQDNARKAHEAETLLNATKKERIEDDIKQAEFSINFFREAQQKALDDGDNAAATKANAEMMSSMVKLDRLQNTLVPEATVQYQAAPIQSYDDLLNAGNITSRTKEFLTDRPELKDPENFRILMDVASKLNKSGEYTTGSPGWLKELDKRLALNEVYDKRDSTDREEDTSMARDRDDYRDRYGTPRDNAPPSIPKGRDGSAPNFRSGKGVGRLTQEERQMARDLNQTEEQYMRGRNFMEYAKAQPANPTNGAVEYEIGDNGKMTVSLGSYADFHNMYNRARR